MANMEFSDDEMQAMKEKLDGCELSDRERQYLETALQAARTESQLISLREQLGKSYSSYSSGDDSGVTLEVKARIKPTPPIK